MARVNLPARAAGRPADLVEVRVPVPDRTGVLAEVTTLLPGVKVLMLTWSEDGRNLLDAIRAGAKGYLLHATFTAEQLCDAVRTVHDGGAVISPFLAPHLLNEFLALSSTRQREESVPTDGLTTREQEILQLIRNGLTNRRIAEQLGVSEKTVKNHINNIYSKLQVHSRGEIGKRGD